MTKHKIVKRSKRSADRFFVVNHRAPNNGDRTIFDVEDLAVDYAKELVNSEHNRFKQTTLYVVKICKVVTTGQPPVSVLSPRVVRVS